MAWKMEGALDIPRISHSMAAEYVGVSCNLARVLGMEVESGIKGESYSGEYGVIKWKRRTLHI